MSTVPLLMVTFLEHSNIDSFRHIIKGWYPGDSRYFGIVISWLQDHVRRKPEETRIPVQLSPLLVCWLVLCQPDTSQIHLGREKLSWENVWPDCPMDKTVGHFLYWWCGRAQFTVGSVTSGLVVLSAIRKQTEPTLGNKPVNSIPPYLFINKLLTWVSDLTSLDDRLQTIRWN